MKQFDTLDWEKMQGILPAVIQDASTGAVLMVGYMNRAALAATLTSKWVTFFSRSKQQLWVKGDTSGNKLQLDTIFIDCDNDALLIFANPLGPTCHQLTTTCFKQPATDWQVLQELQAVIQQRKQQQPENSYTTALFAEGLSRITQKFGEESIEVVLAAIDKNDDAFCGEVADLLFHLCVLLQARDLTLAHVIAVLRQRAQVNQNDVVA